MALVKFFKVATLPGTLQPDSLYFVQNGTYAESYVTDSSGTAKSIGNTAMINALATSLINAALADLNTLQIASTIAERDALTRGRNFMVLVTDATGDPSVSSGAALYAYSEGSDAFTKVAEYESMDVTLQWANIQGRPSSSVAAIDTAVSQAHTHANKANLDKIGEDAEGMTYNGNPVQSRWNTLNW